MNPVFSRIVGNWVRAYTPTWPSQRYQYRHDTVLYNEKPLRGIVQVRYRGTRLETITCLGDKCVMGYNPEWLYAQQQDDSK